MIIFTKNFKKKYTKLDSKIKKVFEKKLALFVENEFDPSLSNHQLNGTYKNYRSIDVSGDIRALYKKDSTVYIFVTIGSHSKLYS